ncbi:MAG: hypothetical protein J2P30_18200 [Actinobacteria bacterium]|nr:hypothetical protein [Actinomycetota bacterium]
MKRIIQYKVKPGQGDRNEELIRAVYAELDRTQPNGLRYATVRLDDGVTFLHIVEYVGEGPSPLTGLASFQKFQDGIADRCQEPPTASQARQIGSFRMFPAE